MREAHKRDVLRCSGCGTPLINLPALQCADCGMVHPLRAFYYKSGSTYVADCLDLNLVSEGPTPENAIERLQEAMSGYLSVAFEGDTAGLVLRPAPTSRWVRYYWHSLKQKLRRHESQNHFLTYEAGGRLQHCP